MAFPADTDSAVRHLLLGEALKEVFLSVNRAGDKVVLGERLFTGTEFAFAYGATKTVGIVSPTAGHNKGCMFTCLTSTSIESVRDVPLKYFEVDP